MTAVRAMTLAMPALPDHLAFLGAWSWRLYAQGESMDEWLARVERLRTQLLASTAAWRHVGQRVLVRPEAAVCSFNGRFGVVHRLGSSNFSDYAFVRFAPAGREKVERVLMLPLEVLIPAEDVP